jgi:mycothiol synthase
LSKVIIRPFRGQDTQSFINLWNQSLPADGITLDLLERKILLDANFDPDGLLIAERDGNLVGFIFCIVRHVPMEGVGLQENMGWIPMMGIHPEYRRQGIAAQLWQKAEEFFKKRNRNIISIANYTPNYFIPGIDIKEYDGAIKFFEKHWF